MDLHWKLYVKLCPVLHSDGKISSPQLCVAIIQN